MRGWRGEGVGLLAPPSAPISRRSLKSGLARGHRANPPPKVGQDGSRLGALTSEVNPPSLNLAPRLGYPALNFVHANGVSVAWHSRDKELPLAISYQNLKKSGQKVTALRVPHTKVQNGSR